MTTYNTNRPSALGVPFLYGIDEGTNTATYPHRITQAGISLFQQVGIDVRIGPPEADIERDRYVQHPEPFDAHGELSVACRTLLLASVQTEVMSSQFGMFVCVVWSPTSCSYVAPDGVIFETFYGLASPASVAFKTMRQLLDTPYPQINVMTPYGITREACPVDVSKGKAVAQAVEIALRTGWGARVVCSDSEWICAQLTDDFGESISGIRPCVIWSQNESEQAVPIDWHTLSGLKHPYIIAGEDNECALFCPDLTTMEELKAKAAEISALGYPRVRIVWSSTETIWVKQEPTQQAEEQVQNNTLADQADCLSEKNAAEEFTDQKVDEEKKPVWFQAEDQKQLTHFLQEINSGKTLAELDAATRAWWWNRY